MEKVKYIKIGGVTYAVADDSKLPMPAEAAVGQVIRVAAVTAEGQVTATEAVAAEGLFPDGDEVSY